MDGTSLDVPTIGPRRRTPRLIDPSRDQRTRARAWADSFGVTHQLRALGIDVKYMGRPLTDMLKGGWKVLTF